MLNDKRILGIIPARGGSKGLPGKNIRPLLGKPLIGWTIEQALASTLLDKVIVNTDDPGIAEASRGYGGDIPFMRPPELARDTSKVIDAVLHVVDTLEKSGERFDYCALLEPTSPLRREGDIDAAITKLVNAGEGAESLCSVGEIALENPLYAKRIGANGYVLPFADLKMASSLRQDLPTAYFPYGVIYLSKIAAIRQHHAVYPDRIIPYVIERWQNYEINDIYDFVCIESILKYRQKEKTL